LPPFRLPKKKTQILYPSFFLHQDFLLSFEREYCLKKETTFSIPRYPITHSKRHFSYSTSSFLFFLLFSVSISDLFSPIKADTTKISNSVQPDPLTIFIQELEQSFQQYDWTKHLNKEEWFTNLRWTWVRKSHQGTPLPWLIFPSSFQDQNPSHEKVNTTLVLCGVHGDEITPVKFCFDLIKELAQNTILTPSSSKEEVAKMIIVAPVVNPDSFFKKRPSRTNARGVDINRNFPTSDWNKKAQTLWKHHYGRDPRRNPGTQSASEQEVIFQINLIKRYRPDKILSVHAPLSMLDYDGPDDKKTRSHQEAFDLLVTMGKSAGGYKIRQFRTYPGSLGQWAGVERKIPTYTLELPSSDYQKTEKFWQQLRPAIIDVIEQSLPTPLYP
jgi:protein MpaA